MPRAPKAQYYRKLVKKKRKLENDSVECSEDTVAIDANDESDSRSVIDEIESITDSCSQISLQNELDDDPVKDNGCERINNISRNSCRQLEAINKDTEYIIIDTSCLQELLRNAKCTRCDSALLEIRIDAERFGFASKLDVVCTYCEDSGKDEVKCASSYTSQSVEKCNETQVFDVNLRLATAFLHIGRGYSAIEQFAMFMNISPFSKTSFHKYERIIHDAANKSVTASLELARDAVKKAYGGKVDETSDISVSFDGSWLTRGYRSQYGIGCIIDVETGYVLDYEIMSKYCHACVIAKQDLDEDSAEFEIWRQGHEANCKQNHEGSSAAMEMVAAEKIWKRSEDYKLRYTTILSDGDAKTFNHLKKLQIYGQSVDIEKEECINHISKRLGTGLRKMVAEWRSRGVTLDGKGHGTLKIPTIDKLTEYYQKAIRRNKDDLKGMRTAIYATIYHAISTDKKPQHDSCPPGIGSWCFYQAAIANGQQPGPHKSCIGTPLKEEYLDKILPIYDRLSSNELLSRCLSCRTQNANESLHSMIWRKCPKDTNPGKDRIEIAVAEAICEFNSGSAAAMESVVRKSGLRCNQKSHAIAQSRDQRRVSRYKTKVDVNFQRARRIIRMAKRRREDVLRQREGPTYGAGEF